MVTCPSALPILAFASAPHKRVVRFGKRWARLRTHLQTFPVASLLAASPLQGGEVEGQQAHVMTRAFYAHGSSPTRYAEMSGRV